MAWNKKNNHPKKYFRSQVVLSVALLLALCVIGFAAWVLLIKEDTSTVVTTPIEVSTATPLDGTEGVEQPDTGLEIDSEKLQETLTEWAEATNGNTGVVIMDKTGEVLASHDPDRVYFAASIYKLYVAYEGYRQVDAGEVMPDQLYLNGFTRRECLDKMIRESDSPCAEKLWVEIGKENLNGILKTYGINNTSMTAIQTTAKDAAIILSRIARGEGLSDESRQALLMSMKNQIFRDALNKGFSEKITVYNKIGFRELVEYHDVAIVQLESGEQIIVSVLTENVGTKNIADLAAMLEPIITQ